MKITKMSENPFIFCTIQNLLNSSSTAANQNNFIILSCLQCYMVIEEKKG